MLRRPCRVDAHVEREHDALGAEGLHPAKNLLRAPHGGGAHYDAGGARIKKSPHILLAPDATARLHGHGEIRKKVPEKRDLALGRILRTRQIHDVQELRPCGLVGLKALEGIVAVASLGAVVALVQPHDAAVDEVDGGDDHASIPRKFAIRRAPARPERSGWNCTPMKFSCAAAAVNSSPYVQRAVVQAPVGIA